MMGVFFFIAFVSVSPFNFPLLSSLFQVIDQVLTEDAYMVRRFVSVLQTWARPVKVRIYDLRIFLSMMAFCRILAAMSLQRANLNRSWMQFEAATLKIIEI